MSERTRRSTVARAAVLKAKAGAKANQQKTRKPPLSEQLEQLRKELEASEKKHVKLYEEKDKDYKKNINLYQLRIKEQQSTISNQEDKIEKLEKEINELPKKIKNETATKMVELEEKVNGLTEILRTTREQVKLLNQSNADLRRNNTDL